MRKKKRVEKITLHLYDDDNIEEELIVFAKRWEYRIALSELREQFFYDYDELGNRNYTAEQVFHIIDQACNDRGIEL